MMRKIINKNINNQNDTSSVPCLKISKTNNYLDIHCLQA